ncbi:GAF domain-containing protein [Leptothermofonsia sichuanensis E412]|uniref:GAF domain-containing protein n=1 Tax=Leptothermofonsia sichuanensis TaxID=2917832 RepID=UPI001CA7B699|nr:adenylate/guanylate cyclase domain-containing protein [Leptothermofonsia sichuanensis]QZZ18949.1 GAF domain-containing protein [Leptothermofonsia sichuanensis E412]
MTTTSPHLPEKNRGHITVEAVPQVDRVAQTKIKVIPTQSEAVASDMVTDLGTRKEEESSFPSEIQLAPSDNGQDPGKGGALATQRGTFRSFLAPLTQERFKEVVTDVERKLEIVNQTLSMLDMQGFDSVLEEMLSSITAKTGELLNADRTTIFLLDKEKDELYTTVAKEGGGTVEIRVPTDKGIAGEVATFKKVVNIPFDFFDDPRSVQAKIQYKNTGYRTYTMLALPLLNDRDELVAVIQLINKLKKNADASADLADRIDLEGFTTQDEQVFREFAPSIRLILESSQSFYAATQKQRAANALIQATQSLSKSSLDLEATLKNVMDEAKKLMHADRSTLWLIDPDRHQLWTKIQMADGSLREIRIPRDAGFAGQVATSGEPLMIPFDLYDQPNSQTSKETDQQTGYRTCSMLCMPVFNADGELIGVTQLINKIKQGDYPPYDPKNYPEAPECWKASFNNTDQEFMKTFNIQAGVALQNAKLFETVRQQEQMQRDILRSLTNGVISTDKQGNIVAANESAKELLGITAQETLEGKPIEDLIRIQKGDFTRWFRTALEGKDEKSRSQYYPDQTLEPLHGGEVHSINLSVNTIADANNSKRVSGALVVMEDISDEKRLKSTMYRYMTQELAEQLLENPDAAKMGGDRKEVTVLFSDIRSYTTLTESLKAEEVVEMLNEYFEQMVDAVFAYKGTLDKYIGDAIMAVFGSPLPLKDHEWMAVQTALEMRHRLAEFNAKRIAHQQTPIQIGIGVNSDVVISGNIGSSKRMEFTAIGDGVNLGSRLEGATKQYGTDIVISEYTYQPCADRIWARELDYIRVKGKDKPVKVYELIGLRSEPLSIEQEQIIEHYHKGRAYYLERNFPMAMAEFGTVLNLNKDDKSATLHLSRCQHWLTNPPPDSWDGSWALTEK